jgi:hypothetical protein
MVLDLVWPPRLGVLFLLVAEAKVENLCLLDEFVY